MSADDLRAAIRAESRAAGVKRNVVPTERVVRRRRRELLVSAIGVLLGVLVVAFFGGRLSLLTSSLVRTLVVIAGAMYSVTLLQKLKHLRSIEESLADLAAMEADAAQRIIDHVVLADVDDGLRSSLLVEDTLDGLLDGAVELTRGSGGTLYLLRPDSTPSVWTRRGDAHSLTHASSPAARVAVLDRPLLVDAQGVEQQIGGARILTPLVVNGVTVGIIEVEVADFGSFDGVDLELLRRYADGAAGALDGSIIYSDAMRRALRSEELAGPAYDPEVAVAMPAHGDGAFGIDDEDDTPAVEPSRPVVPAQRHTPSATVTADGLSLSEEYF